MKRLPPPCPTLELPQPTPKDGYDIAGFIFKWFLGVADLLIGMEVVFPQWRRLKSAGGKDGDIDDGGSAKKGELNLRNS